MRFVAAMEADEARATMRGVAQSKPQKRKRCSPVMWGRHWRKFGAKQEERNHSGFNIMLIRHMREQSTWLVRRPCEQPTTEGSSSRVMSGQRASRACPELATLD